MSIQKIQNIYSKRLVAVLGFLFTALSASAQTYVSAPMTGSYTNGSYYNASVITISPNTVISPGAGQSVRIFVQGCAPLSAGSPAQNYVQSVVPRGAGYNPDAALSSYTNCDVMQTIQYYDGLGRSSQTVQAKASPQSNDIVQPFEYDAFGREVKRYQAYTVTNGSSTGSYRTSAVSEQSAFYNPSSPGAPGIAATGYPYALTVLEPSPLNRVLEQGAPGLAWQPAGIRGTTGRTLVSAYTANNNIGWTDQTNSRQVVKYQVTINADYSRSLASNNTYSDNELYVTVTKDENWTSGRAGTTEEYKDKEERVVVKRTYNYNTSTATLERLSTYYVYDDMGNLAFVLPPGANADNATPNQTTLNNFCYQYQYDQRNRLIKKFLPGKAWEEMVYNKLDQVVLTQDGNQRADSKRGFIKYDGQGRVVMTGIEINHTLDRATIQSIVDGQAGPLWEERYSGTNNYLSYTDRSAPSNVSNMTPLVVNYYDNYSGIVGLPAYTVPSGTISQPTGLLTATRTLVLNANGTYGSALWTIYYYDDKGRNTTIYRQHYLGGAANVKNYDETTNTYNFSNQVTVSTRHHYSVASLSAATPAPAATTSIAYFYDHMGRKTQTWETVVAGAGALPPAVLLSQNEYNELGQLKTKKLHSTDNANTFLQAVNYTYNERGWLKTSSAPLFAMQLNYNDGTTPQYNGNISNQYWGTPGNLAKNYAYSYDNLNRLTAGTASTGNNETGITYDLTGNIKTLVRAGAAAASLTYDTYTGNQLKSVKNSGVNFRTYGTYDANGNAPSNGNGINIAYNLLNLPRTMSGSRSMTYVYDATGNKLRSVNAGITTDYVNGIQYTGSAIDFIQTEEGRVLNLTGSPNYEYTLSDHLGNARVTFDSYSGGSVAKQTDDYYPFGLVAFEPVVPSPKNKYLYNNKELQDGLNQYDYGARFYDPVIGRFNTIDPLAEKDRRWSSYSYGHNNPISHIDVDGMFDWVKDQDGDIKWDKNAKSQATTKEGETYLGKDLKFTFNSYINNTFDGPNPPWGATGDKLTSIINLTSQQDADGNLTSVSVKSSYDVAATGGLSMFKGRNFFPGLGDDQNKAINISNSTGFNATFEQHASVPGLEAAGLALLGYSAVNVAQKLTLGLSGNNLLVSAGTDVFPSATLSVNGNQLFQYNQPSFKATHGNSLIDFGSSMRSPSIIHRPAPNFYNRYNSN